MIKILKYGVLLNLLLNNVKSVESPPYENSHEVPTLSPTAHEKNQKSLSTKPLTPPLILMTTLCAAPFIAGLSFLSPHISLASCFLNGINGYNLCKHSIQDDMKIPLWTITQVTSCTSMLFACFHYYETKYLNEIMPHQKNLASTLDPNLDKYVNENKIMSSRIPKNMWGINVILTTLLPVLVLYNYSKLNLERDLVKKAFLYQQFPTSKQEE